MASLPLVTPSKQTRSSPRTSLGASATPGTGTPRLRKRTPGSNSRSSFGTKKESNLLKQSEDDGEIHNASEIAGDSVQLEQDEVASASTPRAVARSLGAAFSSRKVADLARPTIRAGRISEILDRADIGAEEPGEPEQPEEPEEPGQPEEEDEKYTLKRFVGYRWTGDSIEIQVEWENGEMTWEPEVNLHKDAPEFLFKYWRAQGGRPKNPIDPGIYEIFAILKHDKNRRKLLIEWVGFERSEATWESRQDIAKMAEDVVKEYFDSLKTKGKKK
nr:chromo domain containing protein [Trichoderma stromaticum]